MLPSPHSLRDIVQPHFQFKAIFPQCLAFKLLRYDWEGLERNLAETLASSPSFFSGSPVIIDLEKIESLGAIDFERLKRILLSHRIVAIGICGGSLEQQQAALAAQLPSIKIGKTMTHDKRKDNPPEPCTNTKVITQPIRSGMQVYAKTGDLIVTTQVSSGAELMAHGHIHVYGSLRGKALAGIHGNQEARIFCQSLEAELVAIAGHYLTRDDIILPNDKNGPIQIYLKHAQLQIERL
jgi:septum site-determining protein MinC